MNKSVLLSIQPKWCELIAIGKKTVEVRKSAPKLETPFKCYIYCTQGKTANGKNLYVNPPDKRREYGVVEDWEIKNDKIDIGNGYGEYTAIGASGKVIGEFVCDCIEKEHVEFTACANIGRLYWCRMSLSELTSYIGKGDYAFYWHISELKIYDKPKELSDFFRACIRDENAPCGGCPRYIEYFDSETLGLVDVECYRDIRRPPQSWMYVEEI